MQEGLHVLEGVAADLLEAAGCDDPPVDAYELAECCGLRLKPVANQNACIVGDVLSVPLRARDVRQHGQIAHELGHWALRRAGQQDDHPSVRYVAGALLLPRRHFERDLEDGWDLPRLRARHLHASAEMIGRRIVNLRDAVVSIWDQGKLRRRVVSPWLPERLVRSRVTRIERELAEACLATGAPVHEDSLLAAWPVFSPGWRRVIVVAEAAQLSLRLGEDQSSRSSSVACAAPSTRNVGTTWGGSPIRPIVD